MARVAITRTIHSLPGKREQHLDFMKRSDDVRRKWGMVESLVLEKAIDPSVLLVIQIWESPEHYERWLRNPARTEITAAGRFLRVREGTRRYNVLE